MAFIDFKDGALHALPAPTLARIAESAPHRTYTLTAMERRIVELARGDGLASLRPQRKRSWLARLLLGPQRPSPMLANERLENLRRLSVHVWHHGYQVPASALEEALSAGFAEPEIGAVIDLIGRMRQPFRRLAA